ncbi:hypothetical protein D3C85_1276140 [compost metagenome]
MIGTSPDGDPLALFPAGADPRIEICPMPEADAARRAWVIAPELVDAICAAPK